MNDPMIYSPPAPAIPADIPAAAHATHSHSHSLVIPDSEADSESDLTELSELSELSEVSDLEGYNTDEYAKEFPVGVDVDGNVVVDGDGDGDVDVDGDDHDHDDIWESESIFDDVLDELTAEEIGNDEEAVTEEERTQLRALLKQTGEEGFIHAVIVKGGMSVRKCLTAFNVRPPAFMEDAPDRSLVGLLRIVVGREMMKRTRIPQVNTVERVVELLREAKSIIVLTGAGISTSLGIPDFRSKGSGLYSRLEGLGLSDPQEVFDIDIFNDDPTIFYSVAKDILPTTKTFSPTHAFIELLQKKNKLLTQYTQNIDNLEILAGIQPEKLIQCHGSFASATCVKCKHKVPGEEIFPELRRGVVAKCDNCLKLLAEGSAAEKKRKRAKSAEEWRKKRKRAKNPENWTKKKKYSEDSSADEEESNFREAGVMKPDITFFGEQLPDTFHKRLVDHDRYKCDLLICIGTSLKVAPVSEIIGFLPPDVPQIYISKTPVEHVEFDVELLGECDGCVAELCRLAGWTLQHEMVPETRPEVEWKRVSEGPGNRFEYTIREKEHLS